MRNRKIYFIVFSIVILMLFLIPVTSFSQDSTAVTDFPDIDDNFGIGIGFGIGFFEEDDYYYPEQAFTYFRSVFGYYFDSRHWEGLGFNPLQTPDYDTEYTTLNFTNIYLNTTHNINIKYEHEKDGYTSFFDIGYDLFLRFSFPMKRLSSPDEGMSFFQSEEIVGDNTHIHNKLSTYFMYMIRETKRLYRNGITVFGDIALEMGSEYNQNFWIYLSSEFRFDAELSVIEQFLFFELEGRSRIVSKSLNPNVELPFFAYSMPNTVYPFYLLGTYDKNRDYFSSTIRLDMKSHFYRTKGSPTYYLYIRMAYGLGIFAQASVMGDSTANLDYLTDLGAYIEFRLEEWTTHYEMTAQIGINFNLNKDNTGNLNYIPEFYLRISI